MRRETKDKHGKVTGTSYEICGNPAVTAELHTPAFGPERARNGSFLYDLQLRCREHGPKVKPVPYLAAIYRAEVSER